MAEYGTELIVLGTTKTGEKSLVVHCLSPGWGRRSFITGISKGVSQSLFLPLSILDAEVVENPRSELWRLRNVSHRHALNGIRSSAAKSSMVMFMSEVLYRTIRDGGREDGLFEWCRNSILTLDAIESDFSNYHLRFLMEFATSLGFAPSAEGLAPFAGNRYGQMCSLLRADFGSCLLFPLNGEARSEIAESLLQYIGYHTETRLNIRSLAVLREIYR